MTTVHVDLRRDDGDSTPSGSTGRVEFIPTARRVSGDAVVLPEGFTATLVSGEATVSLAPTTTAWCWKAFERATGGIVRYVAVPDLPTTVEYADLVDVDPATLNPTGPVSSATQAALDAEAATRAAADTALDARVDVIEADLAVPPTWPEVTGKPNTFPPSTHTHVISDVTGLQTALDGKAASGAPDAAVAAHVAASDPHPQYTTAAESDAAIATAVATRAPRNRPLHAVLFGTSIARQEASSQPPAGAQFQTGTESIGMFSQANSMAGNPFRVVYNAGISGNTSAQMLARVQADVINRLPNGGWVYVDLGTPNDIGNGVTLAQSITNHVAIFDAIVGAGLGLILRTPVPYGLSDQRAYIEGTRKWLLSYARENGHPIADVTPTLAATDGSQNWRDNYSDGANAGKSNGAHPSPLGASEAGKVVAETLRQISRNATSPFLPDSNADTWNLLVNGMLQGSGGTTKPNGFTGNLATSWTGFTYSGSAGVGTLAKVARTDQVGLGGEWQQFTFGPANSEGINFQQQNITGLGTTWAIGDVIIAAAEIQVDQNWTGGLDLNLSMEGQGGGTVAVDLRRASSAPGIGQPAASYILSTRGTVPASSTRLTFRVSAKATTGSFRVGRCGMYNATQMAAAGLIPASLAVPPS